MALDIIRMRAKLRKPLGLESDDTDMTNDEADEYLNIAFWSIQGKFPFREKEVTATFLTVAGVRNYDMPKPFDALQQLSIEEPTSKKHSQLIRTSIEDYEDIYENTEQARGYPTHYVREGCFARLLPTPDTPYTIIIKRLITLADISALNPTPGIPQEWSEVIVFGALWRAYIDLGDIPRANSIKQHEIALINTIVPTQAKEERDSQVAGLEVMRRPY